MDCVCYYPLLKTTETVLALQTKEKEDKLLVAAHRWVAIGKLPEAEIAARLIGIADTNCLSVDNCYHPSCYRQFASETKITRAAGVKRKVCTVNSPHPTNY